MGLRVLIVDDALFMRRMLRGILAEEGHEIAAEASDGAEGVRKYRELRPDVTLMDIVMPVQNGIEALREITTLDGNARVVMCSAVGQEALVEEARSAGARGFILKPFQPEAVKEAVRKAAGS